MLPRGICSEVRPFYKFPISNAAHSMATGADLRRTMLCYCMIGCQTASGVWFLIGYQTYFFTVCGIAKAFEFSIMNTCFGFLGVNIGMYAIRNLLGRRGILMLGAIACGLCQLATAIAATVSPNSLPTGQTLVAFTALFMFFYNGCVGAASYPVATELVSSRLRAWTVGTATSLGYLLAWLTNFCTPYFINPEHLNWVSLWCLSCRPMDLTESIVGGPLWLHMGGF